jgi:hypothetical protein
VDDVSDRLSIDLDVRLSGAQAISETTAICAGPYVLMISTALPDHRVVFQLTSTFVGYTGVDTHVTHLTLGPVGEDPTIETEDHPHDRLDPAYGPRECAYQHIHVLMEHLKRLGHEPAIDLPDDAFDELEGIEP